MEFPKLSYVKYEPRINHSLEEVHGKRRLDVQVRALRWAIVSAIILMEMQ